MPIAFAVATQGENVMTWSVSASGTKEAVKKAIEKQISPDHPVVAAGICALVDDACGTTGTHASVSGSGSTSISLSISTWRIAAEASGSPVGTGG
jgi:hypothetical protein